MRPKTSIQTPAIVTRGATRHRQDAYNDKLAHVYAGTFETSKEPFFYPAEFVQYLIDKQDILPEDLDRMLGYAADHFRTNIFNTMLNDGGSYLPKPFRAKIAMLTGTDRNLWLKRNFTLADAEGVTINTDEPNRFGRIATTNDTAQQR